MSDKEGKNPVPDNLIEHAWKPGQSGNPNGRIPIPAEARALRRLNRHAFELILDELMFMSRDQLATMVNKELNPDAGKELVVKVAIAKMILDRGGKGMSYLLDQSIGKATIKIEASGPNNTPLLGSTRTPEERARRLQETLDALEKIKKAEEIAKLHGYSTDPIRKGEAGD